MSNRFFEGGENVSSGGFVPLRPPWLRACYEDQFVRNSKNTKRTWALTNDAILAKPNKPVFRKG